MDRHARRTAMMMPNTRTRCGLLIVSGILLIQLALPGCDPPAQELPRVDSLAGGDADLHYIASTTNACPAREAQTEGFSEVAPGEWRVVADLDEDCAWTQLVMTVTSDPLDTDAELRFCNQCEEARWLATWVRDDYLPSRVTTELSDGRRLLDCSHTGLCADPDHERYDDYYFRQLAAGTGYSYDFRSSFSDFVSWAVYYGGTEALAEPVDLYVALPRMWPGDEPVRWPSRAPAVQCLFADEATWTPHPTNDCGRIVGPAPPDPFPPSPETVFGVWPLQPGERTFHGVVMRNVQFPPELLE